MTLEPSRPRSVSSTSTNCIQPIKPNPVRKFQLLFHKKSNRSNARLISNIFTMAQSKADKIEQTRQNLPLPEQPPQPSDWQSADARNVNVGSGGLESDFSTGDASTAGLREPSTKSSAETDMSGIGRQGKDNLSEPPKDARAR